MLNRWHAIIWTSADPVYWHIYAALGGVLKGDWTAFMKCSILCPLMLLWFMLMLLLFNACIHNPSSFYLVCDSACFGPLHSSYFIKWFVMGLYLWKETAFNMKSVVLCYTHPTIMGNVLWVITHEISQIFCRNISFLDKLFAFVGYLSRYV